jgi:hypothetical protein
MFKMTESLIFVTYYFAKKCVLRNNYELKTEKLKQLKWESCKALKALYFVITCFGIRLLIT